MLSVAVHKDIAEYQPKIVGKMTMRTLASRVRFLSRYLPGFTSTSFWG